LAFVGIFIAIAIAVGSWFRPASGEAAPSPEPAQQYSDQQVAEAATNMCAVYDKIYAAITNAGGQNSDDPTMKFVIAVDIRLATHVNSDYIRQMLGQNAATPPDLAHAFREMRSAYDEINLAQLANAPKEQLESASAKLDSADATVYESCE
jgi:hypothetical protein